MRNSTVAFVLVLVTALGAHAEPTPLPRAHAHNDYEHARPLSDALDQGFGSVEADVHLVDGRLLVAHDRKAVNPARTLESLYLDPLRARVVQNGGRVYRGGPTIILLVDVKSEADATYAALDAVLRNYAEMLTVFHGDRVSLGAITVIISGNRARGAMAAQAVRFAAMDGRIDDLAVEPAKDGLIPLVSDNWEKVFGWKWTRPIAEVDVAKLAVRVKQAHAQGRMIRFWNTPDTPEAWRVLNEAGVDLINTDHLAELRRFFESTAKTKD